MEQVVEEQFTKNFRQLVEKCLQKNPAKRPKSQELLASKHLDGFQDEDKRNMRRTTLVEQVCELIEDVGSSTSMAQHLVSSKSGMPGNTPISIIMSTEENNRPAGTTWVFADGSQVLASSTTNNSTVDDVMEELDQFGQQTGGEHYKGVAGAKQEGASGSTAPASGSGKDEDEPDDLMAFMDEFELNTQGENFSREGKGS